MQFVLFKLCMMLHLEGRTSFLTCTVFFNMTIISKKKMILKYSMFVVQLIHTECIQTFFVNKQFDFIIFLLKIFITLPPGNILVELLWTQINCIPVPMKQQAYCLDVGQWLLCFSMPFHVLDLYLGLGHWMAALLPG